MKKTIIKGTGRYVPPRVVTNHELTQWMDTSDEWIRQRTGIEQRYWVPEGDEIGPSDLGLEASRIALKRAGWNPSDIDLIIFATMTPDVYLPGSGCYLQHKLGLDTTPALDIRQQCTGFIYGMTIADAFIRSGFANRILFVGSEVQSTALDISTRGRDISVIFGDGAGAVCLEGAETDESVKIIRSGIDQGINYVDTAWPYHLGDSEKILGEALKNGYREKVKLATKLPLMLMRNGDGFDNYLETQMKRLQAEYLDIYLMHGLDRGSFERAKRWGLFKKFEEAKEEAVEQPEGEAKEAAAEKPAEEEVAEKTAETKEQPAETKEQPTGEPEVEDDGGKG